MVAPVHARFLAVLARPLIPLIGATRDTRYHVEHTAIIAQWRIPLREVREVVTVQRPIWNAAADYSTALLAALILATPGWAWRTRTRALAWGLGLLTLTQLTYLAINVGYTQLWPITTKYGTLRPPGYSRAKFVLFDWLYAFFEFMGRGFFALVIYVGAVAFTWGQRADVRAVSAAVGRNDPCPCGSGLKAKRCCGA